MQFSSSLLRYGEQSQQLPLFICCDLSGTIIIEYLLLAQIDTTQASKINYFYIYGVLRTYVLLCTPNPQFAAQAHLNLRALATSPVTSLSVTITKEYRVLIGLIVFMHVEASFHR